jgi:hypothetical protein
VSARGRPPRDPVKSEVARVARLERAAVAAARVSGRGEILAVLSPSARAGVLARAARLENA